MLLLEFEAGVVFIQPVSISGPKAKTGDYVKILSGAKITRSPRENKGVKIGQENGH